MESAISCNEEGEERARALDQERLKSVISNFMNHQDSQSLWYADQEAERVRFVSEDELFMSQTSMLRVRYFEIGREGGGIARLMHIYRDTS